jgi:hypothetical protein
MKISMKKKNSNKKTTILIIKILNRKLVGIFFNVGVIHIIFQSYNSEHSKKQMNEKKNLINIHKQNGNIFRFQPKI